MKNPEEAEAQMDAIVEQQEKMNMQTRLDLVAVPRALIKAGLMTVETMLDAKHEAKAFFLAVSEIVQGISPDASPEAVARLFDEDLPRWTEDFMREGTLPSVRPPAA
jgi:hypothetical protein